MSKVIDNITFRKFNNVYKPCRTNNDWLTSDSNSVDDYNNALKQADQYLYSAKAQGRNKVVSVHDQHASE